MEKIRSKRSKVHGNSIHYNVYTNEFGDTVNVLSNQNMLEQIQDSLDPIMMKYRRPKQIDPTFVIVDKCIAQHFLGKEFPGKIIKTITLHPGERREHAIKRHESIKRGMNQTHSIMESSDTACMDSFDNHLENEITQRNSAATEVQSFLNQSASVSTQIGLSADSIDFRGSIKEELRVEKL